MIKSKKICFVITAEFVVKAFLLNHLRSLSDIYDVTVIVNTNNIDFLQENDINVRLIPMSIARDISLVSDIVSLIKLIQIFSQEHFSSVHSVTPKAGMLAILAAWLVRVPLRVHTFTGQVWVTKVGFRRYLIKQCDRLITLLATSVIVDSPSQRMFLVNEKVLTLSNSIVFGKGSISGVDVDKFKPNINVKTEVRKQLNISGEAILFLFVGRLTKDKGVLDLAKAFNQLPIGYAHLLFVGPDEANMQSEIMCLTGNCEKYVHFVGYSDTPASFMNSADVLFLPSYREGFGTVIIEAAAVGIPAIASRIYGVSDAVVDGETGLLHTPHDVEGIYNCMEIMIKNRELMKKLGCQARSRAVVDFNSKDMTINWINFYRENI